MSRHRTAGIELADRISRVAKRILSDDVTRELTLSGIATVRVVPFSPNISTSPALSQLKAEAEELIRLAHLEDFRDAAIVIQLTPRERIGRCVAGSVVTARRFNLVDVRIKADVRTRWVHPTTEVEFSRQWVIA